MTGGLTPEVETFIDIANKLPCRGKAEIEEIKKTDFDETFYNILLF